MKGHPVRCHSFQASFILKTPPTAHNPGTNSDRLLKRTMVENNGKGQSTPRTKPQNIWGFPLSQQNSFEDWPRPERAVRHLNPFAVGFTPKRAEPCERTAAQPAAPLRKSSHGVTRGRKTGPRILTGRFPSETGIRMHFTPEHCNL